MSTEQARRSLRSSSFASYPRTTKLTYVRFVIESPAKAASRLPCVRRRHPVNAMRSISATASTGCSHTRNHEIFPKDTMSQQHTATLRQTLFHHPTPSLTVPQNRCDLRVLPRQDWVDSSGIACVRGPLGWGSISIDFQLHHSKQSLTLPLPQHGCFEL